MHRVLPTDGSLRCDCCRHLACVAHLPVPHQPGDTHDHRRRPLYQFNHRNIQDSADLITWHTHLPHSYAPDHDWVLHEPLWEARCQAGGRHVPESLRCRMAQKPKEGLRWRSVVPCALFEPEKPATSWVSSAARGSSDVSHPEQYSLLEAGCSQPRLVQSSRAPQWLVSSCRRHHLLYLVWVPSRLVQALPLPALMRSPLNSVCISAPSLDAYLGRSVATLSRSRTLGDVRYCIVYR